MAANMTEWDLQLIDGRTGRPIDDDSGKCFGITPGAGLKATLYSDENGTALTQPVSFTNGRVRFFTAASVTALDLTGLTSSGHGFFIEDLTPSQHRYVLWPNNDGSVFALPYELNATVTGGVVDSGVDLPDNVLVKDVYIDALVVATGGALNVGVSTDPDGFVVGVSVSTTGLKMLDHFTSVIFGALIHTSATSFVAPKKHRRVDATSGARLVYQDTTASTTAGSGFIFLKLDRVPSR
jgi:hypothetical protein